MLGRGPRGQGAPGTDRIIKMFLTTFITPLYLILWHILWIRNNFYFISIHLQCNCVSPFEILALQVANRHNTLLRPLAVGDEIVAANVHIHSWRETYAGVIDDATLDELPIKFAERVERWQNIIDESLSACDKKTIVAVKDKNIVGFARVGVDRDGAFEGAGELWSLYLLRACQRKQIGYLLLCEAMKFLRENGYRSAYAWVLAANPTMAFYRRSGAVETGIRKTLDIGGKQYEAHAMQWNSLDQFV